MRYITRGFRFLHIYFVLVRYGFDQVILATPWFYPIRFLAYLNPFNWRANKSKSHGERIRLILQELGPIYVKFGQVLSTRRDLLPDDIAEELAKLQDNVAPFPGEQAQKIVEKTYNKNLNDIFDDFRLVPAASASIAQVHFATLKTGEKVAVKILRPGVKNIIQQDIDLLYLLASLVERYWSEGKRLHPKEIIKEFEHSLLDELDLMREAANASQLRRNFKDYEKLHVPEIYWDYCHHNVLVMERISGIPVTDMNALKQHNVNLQRLAERGVEIFFTQVFRDCFFHADMHPGNIFVSQDNVDDPQYIAVDFGIMGTLSPEDQRYLAENLLAFFKRDYRRVAELHIESGWIPPTVRIDEFESAIRTVCEPVIERPLIEISFARLIIRLFQTAKRFQMEVQPQLILLQKTLFNVEGLGRQLYPELDLWATAQPFLEKWIKKQIGPQAFLRKFRDHGPFLLEKLPEFPEMVYNLLQDTSKNQRMQQIMQIQQLKQEKINEKKKKKSFAFGSGLAFIAYSITNIAILPAAMIASAAMGWLLFSSTVLGILLLLYSFI